MNNLSRNFSSVFYVNLLYLVTILLNLSLGSWMESLHLIWGLIASEVLLFLLPTIAFLRLRRIPIKEGLRIKPIRPLIGLLCILLGFASYLFVVVIDAVMARLTTIPIIPVSGGSVLPKGTLESMGLFIAMAVAAPLCEEPLFRGVIQVTYEKQRTISSAIATTALMFAFWHFQLSGLWGLLLVAFILGYVAWRSGSIITSILVHFGLNATSVANSLLSLNTGNGLPFLGLPAAAGGLAMTAGLIFAIRRLTPIEQQPAPIEQGQPRSWLWNYSPLAVVGLLYLGIIGLTLTTGHITLSQAGYNKVQIDQVLESRYQITNPVGQRVGDLNCKITPQGTNARLDCTGNVGAYEVKTSAGNIKDDNHSVRWSAVWNTDTMGLLDFAYERTYEGAGNSVRASVEEGRMVVENSAGTQEIDLSPDDLVEYEWAWRVNVLKPQFFTSIQAPFAHILWWDEQTGILHPALINEVLKLYQSETLDLPAGLFQAHKASVGGQSAWYANGHAGPVRIDDGMLIYELDE
ncbi:MAG TPA: type II CAAX endopeptidase family protein [Anaerolineaceae bacterium]|nr:type II CAAX endopeptidase family protein [Anaerolineaceae bacterium]